MSDAAPDPLFMPGSILCKTTSCHEKQSNILCFCAIFGSELDDKILIMACRKNEATVYWSSKEFVMKYFKLE